MENPNELAEDLPCYNAQPMPIYQDCHHKQLLKFLLILHRKIIGHP
jgi:hypothetical protein